MINKIKDFLKNKLTRRNQNQSDQDSSETNPDEIELNWKERLFQSIDFLKSKYQGRRLKPFKISTSQNTGSKLAVLSPSVGKFIEKILAKEYRENIHQGFLVLMICSVTYTLGKLAALTIKGSPTTDSPSDYAVTIPIDKDFNPMVLSQVKSSNIFRTNTGLGSKKQIADTKCETAQGETNLPIKLMNTIVLQDSVKSLASVQIRGERLLEEIREGEQISNLAKVFKIDRMEILIKNLQSGACESVTSNKFKETSRNAISVMSPKDSRKFLQSKRLPGIENLGNKFKISKTLLDDKLKDISNILSQARAIKIQNPDGSLSFKLTELDPEGIFPYLGLQDQDIITSINGKPIYDMNEVMALFGRIKNLENLSLGIRREGSDSLQEYSINK
jgi:type II secretory pathway component PulC